MRRVHRSLTPGELTALRRELEDLVPDSRAGIAELIRAMRLLSLKSQIEYAAHCGVSPRVLADVEAGKGTQTTETLGKLLKPFGYVLGVVAPPSGPP